MATTRETRDKEKTYREKVASFWFDLAKLIFAAMVIGGMMQFMEPEIANVVVIGRLTFGTISTMVFYRMGCNILKK